MQLKRERMTNLLQRNIEKATAQLSEANHEHQNTLKICE